MAQGPGIPAPVGDDYVPQSERPGVLNLDLIGKAPGVVGEGLGAIGTVASAGLGGLADVLGTPFRIAAKPIAEARVLNAIKYGDQQVDQRYLNMVAQGTSISEVADQMLKDGVGLSGGVAHDLLANIFLDPFNLIAAGFGKAVSVGRRASDIQSRYTDSAHTAGVDAATRAGALEADIKWLNSKPGKALLGRMYTRSSRGLGGITRGVSQAMFGKTMPYYIAALGGNVLRHIFAAAEKSGKYDGLVAATGAAAHHITMDAGAALVVRRMYGEVRAAALKKAQIIAMSNGVDDAVAYDRFERAVSLGADTGDMARVEIRAQWEMLHTEYAGMDRNRAALADAISNNDTAALINQNVGKNRVGVVASDMRATDEVFIKRILGTQKDFYVSENLFILANGANDAERVQIARYEFVQNLSPILGASGAEDAWRLVLLDIGTQKNTESLLRKLSEAMYTSQQLRFGATAEAFGAAKQAILKRMDDVGELFGARLPEKTRAMIVEQVPRLTVVARDTLTDVDAKNLSAKLADETIDVGERAQEAVNAVYQFTLLRKQFHAPSLLRIANEDPERVVKMVQGIMTQTIDQGSLLKEVPIVNWKGISGVIPELGKIKEAVQRGGYRLVLEPETAATVASKVYSDQRVKDVYRLGVDMWVPITGGKLNVSLGNRNTFGRALDVLLTEKSTAGVMANVLVRMQEFAVANNIPLSRDEIIALHKTLTNRSFKSGDASTSIRSEARTEIQQFDNSNSSTDNILDAFAKAMKDRGDFVSAQKFAEQIKNGNIRRMVYYAAEGDWTRVGTATKFTGYLKNNAIGGDTFTLIGDQLYPMLKFRVSQIFSVQDITESRFWNGIRGYQDEWNIGRVNDVVRYGNKRKYKVTDPFTGQPMELDATEIVSEALMSTKDELRYAQQMGLLHTYYGSNAAEAVLTFGRDNEGFVRALRAALGRNYSDVKNLDYLKYVAAEGLDDLAENFATRMEAMNPVAWAQYMSYGNGDPRAATLLFLRERQAAIRGESASRALFDSQKPMGVGFGRRFDDDVLKLIDKAAADAGKTLRVSNNPNANGKMLRDLSTAVNVLIGDAKAIGYSDEAIAELSASAQALSAAAENLRFAGKTGKLAKNSKTIITDALGQLSNARNRLRTEFVAATQRRKVVEDLVMSLEGVTKKTATELGNLFVVAERRKEMLPGLSNQITAITRGEGSTENLAQRIADHLIKIREGRTEEETMWNAVMHALTGAARRAEETHYFKTSRHLLERSLNHPVFAAYPVSYMFGKVLGEYSRALYLSPTKGINSIVLAPWTAILNIASGGKFTAKSWGQFAPLVGFNAVRKIRDAMLRSNSEQEKPSALTYLFANVLTPGLPTEISVSVSAPVRRVIEGVNGEQGFGDTLNDVLYAGEQQLKNISGPARLLGSVRQVISEGMDTLDEEGGLIGAVGSGIGNAVESIGDFLRNE
jgi:hypothetical protein